MTDDELVATLRAWRHRHEPFVDSLAVLLVFAVLLLGSLALLPDTTTCPCTVPGSHAR
jgi:hypothetical protein